MLSKSSPATDLTGQPTDSPQPTDLLTSLGESVAPVASFPTALLSLKTRAKPAGAGLLAAAMASGQAALLVTFVMAAAASAAAAALSFAPFVSAFFLAARLRQSKQDSSLSLSDSLSSSCSFAFAVAFVDFAVVEGVAAALALAAFFGVAADCFSGCFFVGCCSSFFFCAAASASAAAAFAFFLAFADSLGCAAAALSPLLPFPDLGEAIRFATVLLRPFCPEAFGPVSRETLPQMILLHFLLALLAATAARFVRRRRAGILRLDSFHGGDGFGRLEKGGCERRTLFLADHGRFLVVIGRRRNLISFKTNSRCIDETAALSKVKVGQRLKTENIFSR